MDKRRVSLLLSLVLLTACGPAPGKVKPAATSKPRQPLQQGATEATRTLTGPLVAADLIGKIRLISEAGGAVISNNGAGLISEAVPPAELDAAFGLIRRLLKPGGRLVLGDILQPEIGMPCDVLALLRFGARHGFLRDALLGLISTALSDYRQLRARVGLQRYSEAEMLTKLAACGFTVSRADSNLGHNPWRMTFVAQPSCQPPDHGRG